MKFIVVLQPEGWIAIAGFINSSSMRMRTVADRHILAGHYNKDCWPAFRGYQHRWPWTTV